jgi:hypothetical protein
MAEAQGNSNGTNGKKATGRPLHELVDLETFIVEYVSSYSCAVNISPESETVYGGSSSSYLGGYTAELHLKVTPDNLASPTRELTFKGNSPVRGGDYIAARIPHYTDKSEVYNRRMKSCGFPGKQIDSVYVRRAQKGTEEAIEMSIILQGEEKEKVAEQLGVDPEQFEGIIRTDHSVNYSAFVKEEKEK